MRGEAEGHNHGIAGNHFFAAGNDFGAAAALCIRLAHLGFHNAQAGHFALGIGLHRHRLGFDGHGLSVELKSHALFLRVGEFFAAAGHIGGIAAVNASHFGGILAHGSAHAIHGGVAAAEHHHALAGHAHEIGAVETEQVLGVADQKRQRRIHALGVFIGNVGFHALISAHAEKHGIVFGGQIIELHIAADFHAELEGDAHFAKHFAPAHHHFFFQLEGGNAEGEQAADFGLALIHGHVHTVAGEHIGAAQAGRPRADHGHFFAGFGHMVQIGAPAHFKGGFGDVFFHIADGYGAKFGIERAIAFAQAVLRAHPAAHFGQAVGGMCQLRRFDDAAFVGQAQPVGDVVVQRAFVLAIRVAAA